MSRTVSAALFFVLWILALAYLNGRDLQECQARGHSAAVCYATLNP